MFNKNQIKKDTVGGRQMNDSNLKISITGDLGSGKSSICDILHEKYKFHKYSTGVIQREIASQHGMTTYDFNKYMESHPEVDKEIDSKLRELANIEEDIVIDSRMAWYFIPNTFKVFLAVNISEAAQRIINANRGNIEQYQDIDEAIFKLRARKESENNRYRQQYGVDCSKYNNYDIIIDTTVSNPVEIADLILDLYKQKNDGNKIPHFWCSYQNMYPTQTIKDLNMAKIEEYKKQIVEGNKLPLIDALKIGDSIFIYNGHHRICAYALSGINMIPYTLKNEDSEKFKNCFGSKGDLRKIYELKNYYDWEDMLNFKFKNYPIIPE